MEQIIQKEAELKKRLLEKSDAFKEVKDKLVAEAKLKSDKIVQEAK